MIYNCLKKQWNTLGSHMNELMIDLETLGTGPDTIVISLGAVFFDLDAGKLGATFYMAFDIEDQIKIGRSFTADTLKFWMNQEGAAKKVFHEQAKPTKLILDLFAKWVKDNSMKSKVKPWGNGSHFDISIMESLFHDFGIECPWLFYNVMDVRTLRRFLANNEKIPKPGTNHHALDDAKTQAEFCIQHYAFYKKMLEAFAELAKANQAAFP